MSDWLYWVCSGVIRGTCKTAGFAIDKGFAAIEAIAGRKVGEYVLPVITIDQLRGAFGGQQARHIILGMRQPTLDELHVRFPGEDNPSDYRVISLNPRDYEGRYAGDLEA